MPIEPSSSSIHPGSIKTADVANLVAGGSAWLTAPHSPAGLTSEFNIKGNSKAGDYTGIWSLFNTRSLCNKLDEFQMFLYEQNVDICCVTETWLTSVVPNSLICPPGYVVFRRDRETPGGVWLFLLKTL